MENEHSRNVLEKIKARNVLDKLKSEIKSLKDDLLDKEVMITPQIAQDRFNLLYKNQKDLPAGEYWAIFFDKELLLLFAFIRVHRNDIFESKGNINWEAYKYYVRL
jgi:hypothetical protein